MPTVSFTIPAVLVTELNLIAAAEGFPDAKAWVIHWLREKIKANRGNKAGKDAREAAEAQADLDMGGIT